jgi:phosphoribosylanthranilate isomerase
MNLEKQIAQLAHKSAHRQIAVVQTQSHDKARKMVQAMRSPIIELHTLEQRTVKPVTKIENVKVGKQIGAAKDGVTRHKATCEVLVSAKPESTFFIVVLLSKRQMRHKVEAAAGVALDWMDTEEIRTQSPITEDTTTAPTNPSEEPETETHEVTEEASSTESTEAPNDTEA